MERIAPLAKILAEANGIEWEQLRGTGAGGTIVEQDILDYLTRVMSGEAEPPSTPVDAPPPDWNGEEFPGAGTATFDAGALSRAGVESDIADFVSQVRPATPAPAHFAPTQAAPAADDFELDDAQDDLLASPAPAHTPSPFAVPPVMAAVPTPPAGPAAPVMPAVSPTPAPQRSPFDVPPVTPPQAPQAPAPQAQAPQTAAPATPGGLGSLLSRLYQQGDQSQATAPVTPPAPVTPTSTPPATFTPTPPRAEAPAFSAPSLPAREEPAPYTAPRITPPEPAQPEPVAFQSTPPQFTPPQATFAPPTFSPPVMPAAEPAREEMPAPTPAPVFMEAAPEEPIRPEPTQPEPVQAVPTPPAPAMSEPVQKPERHEPEAAPEVAVTPPAQPPTAPMPNTAPATAPGAVWFGSYLRREADVSQLLDLRAQLGEALGREVPLGLLVARAAQRHAAALGLAEVAVHGYGGHPAQQIGGAVGGSVSLRDALQAFGEAQEGTPDLLIVDAGALDLDDLHYPHTLTLSVGRVQGGRAGLSLQGDVDPEKAAHFLASVAQTLEKPVILLI